MQEEFLLYSIRLQGWATASGVYSSDYKQAKRFTAFEASVLINKHFDEREKVFGMIQVRWQDLIDAVPNA